MPAFKSDRTFSFLAPRVIAASRAAPGCKAFNTAFITDAKGRILGRYHKQVLLAFGEYLPFAKLLSLLPAMPFADGFTPGPGPMVFHMPRGVRVAPLICYEDLMPDLSRSSSAKRAPIFS